MACPFQPVLGAFSSPVSLLAISGDSDPLAPLEGGFVGRRRKTTTRPARAHVEDWARANGLEEASRTVRDDASATTVRWGGGAPRPEVSWVVVKGHGHRWAGGAGPNLLGGPTSNAVDATREMWDFFARHPKPAG